MMDGHKVPTTNKTPREKRSDVAAVLQLHVVLTKQVHDVNVTTALLNVYVYFVVFSLYKRFVYIS